MNTANPRVHAVIKCWSLSRRGNGQNTLCACCGAGINRYVRIFRMRDGSEIHLGKQCANRLTAGTSYLTDDAMRELAEAGVRL